MLKKFSSWLLSRAKSPCCEFSPIEESLKAEISCYEILGSYACIKSKLLTPCPLSSSPILILAAAKKPFFFTFFDFSGIKSP